MARLSLGSQHFQVLERRKSLAVSSARKVLLTEPDAPDAESGDEEPPLEQYARQNKLLAMENSGLAVQIAQLEATAEHLARDNAELAQENALLRDGAGIGSLSACLESLEATIADKFADILRAVQRLRQEEGLSESTLAQKLDAVLRETAVATSTPEAERRVFLELWEKKREASVLTEASTVSSAADLAMMEGASATQNDIELKDNQELLTETPTEKDTVKDTVKDTAKDTAKDTVEPSNIPTDRDPVEETAKVEAKRVEKPTKKKPFLDYYEDMRKPDKIVVVADDSSDDSKTPTTNTRKRKPLTNVTNARPRRPRKAKASENAIFDFVDHDELVAQTRQTRSSRADLHS